jgi:hypothetical protein
LRRAVRTRFPELADRVHFVEQMAAAWNADPSAVPGPRLPAPSHGPAVAAAPARSWPWRTGRVEPNSPEG